MEAQQTVLFAFFVISAIYLPFKSFANQKIEKKEKSSRKIEVIRTNSRNEIRKSNNIFEKSSSDIKGIYEIERKDHHSKIDQEKFLIEIKKCPCCSFFIRDTDIFCYNCEKKLNLF